MPENAPNLRDDEDDPEYVDPGLEDDEDGIEVDPKRDPEKRPVAKDDVKIPAPGRTPTRDA